MKLRIRTKFIGILVLAAVLPLVVALIAGELIGYGSFRRSQGSLFQSRAQGLAESLRLTMSEPVEALDDWVALADVHPFVVREAAKLPPIANADLEQALAPIEQRWPTLGRDDPLLGSILNNPLSAKLHLFQTVNPIFAEVLMTDAQGRLIAATEKTTDYWQADETWWQHAAVLGEHHASVAGIHYDASARVHSLDVSIPILDWQAPEKPPVGVIKGVVNASPLFTNLGKEVPVDGCVYQVVLGDGRILARLHAESIEPGFEPLSERIAPEMVSHLASRATGWTVGQVNGPAKMVAGFAPLRFSQHVGSTVVITGLTPLFVVVSRPADEVFGPVRNYIVLLGVVGGTLLLAFTVAGYFIAERHILRPLEALRHAAQALASTAKLDDAAVTSHANLPALEPLRRISTGDELEALAGEFAYMAGRVLTYHERLESEIAEKTAGIDLDLEMAREFQEALMPRVYPRVPSADQPDAIALEFHHHYQPASSVGGDFFDVFKLGDHRAGVFIADVMGHGARSALVTAILRTLLQNLAAESEQPAVFLAALNRHFQQIMRNSPEFVFVTAFYIVIDTQASTATFASAGHPSPLLADRTRGLAEPLLGSLHGNPALGVFPEATYSQWSRPVREGEVFVLLTDGVHEASNRDGEEFGLPRLRAAFESALRQPGAEIGRVIVDELHRFVNPEPLADDICIVTVEITAARPAPPMLSSKMEAAV